MLIVVGDPEGKACAIRPEDVVSVQPSIDYLIGSDEIIEGMVDVKTQGNGFFRVSGTVAGVSEKINEELSK